MDNLEKIVAEARATFEGISDAAQLEQGVEARRVDAAPAVE